MSARSWVEWVPPAAKGVVTARYEEWDREHGEQIVEARCLVCETPYRYVCTRAAARSHIATFAFVHVRLHAGPFGQRAQGSA